jgi:hypothetical protein
MTSIAQDVLGTIARVAAVFDQLRTPWAIGGSLSSSVHGEPRSTNDIDFIAVLRPEQAREFVSALGPSFYADADVAADAIRRRASFNVIDNETVVKVDVFVPAPGPMGGGQLDRRQRITLAPDLDVWVLGPEDTILQKLRWYEIGGSISQRQWRDIGEVLRVQADRLDMQYLQLTAAAAGLESLLARAIADVHGS